MFKKAKHKLTAVVLILGMISTLFVNHPVVLASSGSSGESTKAYIASFNTGKVDVVDLNSYTVEKAKITVGTAPNSAVINPNGTQVMVTNRSSNTVSVINPETDTVVATIPVGVKPHGVAFTSDGSKAYVANYGSDTLSVIDTATNTIMGTINVLQLPVAMVVIDQKLYLTQQGADKIAVIDLATDTVTGQITVGDSPYGLSANPTGTKIYVANQVSRTVSVINVADNTVEATISVGSRPSATEVSPDGGTVYVANTDSGTVSVINAATNTVVDTIRVGTSPYTIGVSTDGSKAYSINFTSSNLSVIDTATNTVIETIGLSDGPYMVGPFMAITVQQQQAAVPTANPVGSEVASGTTVALSSSTVGADVYYTTDGSTPTASSTLYSAPIIVTSAMTIKAIAVMSGMSDSAVMSESYIINTLDAPVISASAVGDGHATISWSPISGATSYRVYQSTSSGSYGAAEATVDSTVYSSNFTGLTNGTTYYFVVRAVSGGTESSNSNEVSVTPAPALAPIGTAAIAGVTAPVTGSTPVTTLASTPEYTATIAWSPAAATFAAGTAYTATITLTPEAGYTLTGVPEDFFTIAGATTTNAADSGVITAEFPETARNIDSGGNIGGGGSVPTSGAQLTLPAGEAGEVSFGDEVTLSIPVNATEKELKVTIDKLLDTQQLLTDKDVPASSIFEILKNFPEDFTRFVTLTFKFDPTKVNDNQKPAVFYYDEVKKIWIEVTGGKVNGNKISVEVNHFTKFAVFVVGKEVNLAQKIKLNTVYKGQLSGQTDNTDMYTFVVQEPSLIDLKLSQMKSEPLITLYDETGVHLSSDLYNGIYRVALKPGTYTIELNSYMEVTSPYTLELKATPVENTSVGPNDTIELAQPVAFGQEIQQVTTTGLRYNSVYKVEVPEDGVLTVKTSHLDSQVGLSNAEMHYFYLHEKGKVHAVGLQKGTYYVRVLGHEQPSSFVINFEAKPIEYESNDSTVTAQTLPIATLTHGYLLGPDDTDIFKVKVEQAGEYRFTVNNLELESYTDLYVYVEDEQGTIVLSDFVNATKQATLTEGTYYIGIKHGSVQNAYNILWEKGYKAIFKDVKVSHPYFNDIMELNALGVIKGYEDKTFKPNEFIKRHHVAAMLVRAKAPNISEKLTMEFTFKDVLKNHANFTNIHLLAQSGIIDQNEMGFKPNNMITRAQMAKMLVHAYGLTYNTDAEMNTFKDIEDSAWYAEYVKILASHGITTGSNGYFKPNEPLQRQQFAALLARTLKLQEN
ncbi:S-layer homology domain-containing protein [Metasolibacillus sp. FSL H7-0170]|uniref:S-layer homology domain-containing protein n=1 Tax=Metasolibacillus sp. FSL H7-0170 TaxID=2921431 RepID=UPI003158A4B2